MRSAPARWPEVSLQVRELLRRGAEVALDPDDAWIEEPHAASLGGPRTRPVAEDPVLAAATRRGLAPADRRRQRRRAVGLAAGGDALARRRGVE